jgi:transcriptional regulator with XRE-family HTH domain
MTVETVSDKVGVLIREARKRRGWAVTDLARCSGLSMDVIQNIEHGRRRDGVRTRDITVDELDAIAAALGVPPAGLYPGLAPGAAAMTVFESVAAVDELIAGLRDARDAALIAQAHRDSRKS